MDAEIIENTRLTFEEFCNLTKMLKASDEDYNVACENVKNLNLDKIYLKLIAKELSLMKRRRFIAYMVENNISLSYDPNELTFKVIHSEIKESGHEEHKYIFEKMVNKSVENSYLDLEDNDYIDFIKVKVKW